MKPLFSPSVVYFGIPMGLLGSAVNGQHLQQQFGVHFDTVLWLITYGVFAFAIVATGYVLGVFNRHKAQLHSEWLNHFQVSLFPSITLTGFLLILTLVTSFTLSPLVIDALLIIYLLIVLLHTLLNVYLLNRWIFSPSVPIEHHKPTWFILLSGNFVLVISGLSLIPAFEIQHWLFWPELLWLYFSGGLLLWFSFTVSLFYRLMFESKIEMALRPSLFIFLAPPSLATVASILLLNPELLTHPQMSISMPPLSWLLFGFASFMLLIWVLSMRYFFASGLTTAAWAYVYPLAAYGLAMQYVAQAHNSDWLLAVSLGLFAVILFIIAILTLSALLDSIKS